MTCRDDVTEMKPKVEDSSRISAKKRQRKRNDSKMEGSDLNVDKAFKVTKKTICEYCGAAFASRGALNNHVYIHTGVTRHVCPHCGKLCRDSYTLRGHVASHDVGSKAHRCAVCGKAYTVKSSLKKHLLEHEGVRKYSCTFCPKTFNHKPHLTRHLRKHTGERPYACTLCDRRFSIKHHRDSHVLLHTDPLPFVCDICGKGFSQSGQLKLHQAQHAKDPATAKRKRKRRHGDDNYCKMCEKSFASRANLVQHETIVHRGVKKFACGKSFGRKHSLKAHMKRHGDQTNVPADSDAQHAQQAVPGAVTVGDVMSGDWGAAYDDDSNGGENVQYGAESESAPSDDREPVLNALPNEVDLDVISSFPGSFCDGKFLDTLPVENEVTIDTSDGRWLITESSPCQVLVLNVRNPPGGGTWERGGDVEECEADGGRGGLTEVLPPPAGEWRTSDAAVLLTVDGDPHVLAQGQVTTESHVTMEGHVTSESSPDLITCEAAPATVSQCVDATEHQTVGLYNNISSNGLDVREVKYTACNLKELGRHTDTGAYTYSEHAYSSLAAAIPTNQKLHVNRCSPSQCEGRLSPSGGDNAINSDSSKLSGSGDVTNDSPAVSEPLPSNEDNGESATKDGGLKASVELAQAVLYLCEICDGSFMTSQQLKTHRKTHATDRKTHAIHRKTHATHRNTHTSVGPPGGGNACGRSSRRKSHPTSDVIGREAVTSARAFACVFCDEQYGEKEELKMHITAHFEQRDSCVVDCLRRYRKTSRN